MEGLKHTKGPWVVDEIGPPHPYTLYIVRAEGFGQIMQTVCKEDARLIAAAPEMLDALLMAHAEMMVTARLQDWHSEEFRRKLYVMQKAIEKAIGMTIEEMLEGTARQEAER